MTYVHVMTMLDIREGVCPLCGHNKIIASAAIDMSPKRHAQYGRQALLAEAVTYEFDAKDDVVLDAFGRIFRYTCQSCGFVQSFASQPQEIPIDKEKYFTWLIEGPAPVGPYR